MGLFSRKKTSQEEMLFQKENRARLEEFVVTKAWGVKKYATANQFIYDAEHKWFVVCEGPEESFREKNPYIIAFDQVTDVSLEIDEYWSEKKDEFAPRGFGRILQEDYSKVYWRYDFYLTISTTHPYAKEIRFQMNFKPTITKVPNEKAIFYRRGFEIGGTYNAKELPALIERMDKLVVDEAKRQHGEKVFDIVTNQRPDTILGKLAADGMDTVYLKKIDNMTAHIKRADRIAKLLL